MHGFETQIDAKLADHGDRKILLILGTTDGQKVGMRAVLDLKTAGADLAGIELGLGNALAKHCLRQFVREGPLSHPFRAGEEEGVGKPCLGEVLAKFQNQGVNPSDQVPGHGPPRFGCAGIAFRYRSRHSSGPLDRDNTSTLPR